MAKQTFTTGQVLTALEMTSLQQTAMGGGSTTAKTTSYVLVAADAGTVVQMNAAGATTITVNTALFSAGDTVQIQNVGAGVCTITAGTATVSTSATLALKQYDAGTLYFNTTSAAIFFAVDAADSPLTTKGDLYTYSTVNDRLAVGTNGQNLVADSTAATGIKWSATNKILQIVSVTNTTNYSNSTSTYADTFSATITPTLNTSKILLIANINGVFWDQTGQTGSALQILRGATLIVGATNIGNLSAVSESLSVGFNYLDSPATTSATVYKLQVKAMANQARAQINRSSPDDYSTITLMEIGA